MDHRLEKIFIVSALLPPAGGGAEVAALAQAEIIRAAGYEVVLVRLAVDDEKMREGTRDGFRVLSYAPWNVGPRSSLSKFGLLRRLAWHALDALNFWSAREFEKLLREEKPTIVVTHNLKGLGYLLPRAAKKFGAKTIHVLHDVQLIEPSGIAEPAVRPTFARRIWSALTRRAFASPDVVIFPSLWLLELSERFGFFSKSKKAVVRNPVPVAAENPARSIKTFLFLGQLEPHKGLRVLLAALRDLPGDWRLIVVGDGSLKKEIEAAARAEPRIEYRGRLGGEALEAVWRETDLALVPSLCAENAPTVIEEAAAHLVPVFATSVGGIPELVRENQTGVLVPPGDVSALGQALDGKLGTIVGEPECAAMRQASSEWSAAAHGRALEEIFKFLT